MKKLITMSLGALCTLSLMSCNTMNDSSKYANSTVGTGVKYTANVVGGGVGVVSKTGAFIGNGVGRVVSSGVGIFTGQPTGYHHVNYSKSGVVYHHGHQYRVQNGKYVLIR